MITISVRAITTGVIPKIPDYYEIIIESDLALATIWMSWTDFQMSYKTHIINFIQVYHKNPLNWKRTI